MMSLVISTPTNPQGQRGAGRGARTFLLSFLESVPGVEVKLKKPNTADEKFEDVVKQAQQAAVLMLVY